MLNNAHLNHQQIRELNEWYNDEVPRPTIVSDFFREDTARALAQCLEQLPVWMSTWSVLDNEEIIDLPEVEWSTYCSEKRFSSQDIADLPRLFERPTLLSPSHQQVLAEFFEFCVLGDGMKSWIAQVIGAPVGSKVSCEFARYKRGDYIVPHSDTHDPRVIGLNIYFDQQWGPSDGGCLKYQNHQGDVHGIHPTFNTAALMPIRTGCTHWVDEWKSDRVGRYTTSLSYRVESVSE